jgi:hypothetical protein
MRELDALERGVPIEGERVRKKELIGDSRNADQE